MPQASELPLLALPTGDDGQLGDLDAARALREIRKVKNEVRVMRAEQRFPSGPEKAKGLKGEWQSRAIKNNTNCCGGDGQKGFPQSAVWVFRSGSGEEKGMTVDGTVYDLWSVDEIAKFKRRATMICCAFSLPLLAVAATLIGLSASGNL